MNPEVVIGVSRVISEPAIKKLVLIGGHRAEIRSRDQIPCIKSEIIWSQHSFKKLCLMTT
jgi:hypothetical protein